MMLKKNLLSVIFVLTFGFSSYAQLPTPNNYIVFVDLSARIEANHQREKDIDLLKYLVNKFKKQVEELYKSGKIYSQDKFSILFYPDLEDENIIELTSSLEVDFSKMDYNNRLAYYIKNFPKDQEPVLLEAFNSVYDIALQQNPNYFGSNIYDFFSYSVEYYLKENYNNHIILFTDGYMYMANENPQGQGNELGHLEGPMLDPFRTNKNWEKLYVTKNYKIVSANIKLPKQTTITLLEMLPDCISRTRIEPKKPCPNEYKVLRRFWQDWFLEMGIDKNAIKIHKSSNNLTGVKSSLDLLFRN
ncbi:hypothetical protein [Winogradskyella aurantiaca]|uniref:hypothetical protein n=1 Tax=Winogradskyella aurantiaca TaxID=2219558 RepID=UPI0013005EF1|nr:hypothetical protein [Winogradskyella aurantiaca]